MAYLSVLDCPSIIGSENQGPNASIDMCPYEGLTPGLVRRHVKVKDGRMIVVCIWKDEQACHAYFDPAWMQEATQLWGDDYQFRFESTDTMQGA